MTYRIMDDYIQMKVYTTTDGESELWKNIAKIVDLPCCRELSQAGNSMEEIWRVADNYFAQLSAIQQRNNPRKETK